MCQPDDPLLQSKYDDFLKQAHIEFVRDPFCEDMHLKSGVSKKQMYEFLKIRGLDKLDKGLEKHFEPQEFFKEKNKIASQPQQWRI